MENSVPKRISFSLKELQELGFIKIPTAKKLIREPLANSNPTK